MAKYRDVFIKKHESSPAIFTTSPLRRNFGTSVRFEQNGERMERIDESPVRVNNTFAGEENAKLITSSI